MLWKISVVFLAAVFAVGFGGLIGGMSNVNIKDEGVQNAANFAVAEHNRRTNDMFLRRMVEVVSAQSQVVAGVKYSITVQMAKTNCRKSRDESNCDSHPDSAQKYQCTFVVWSRPWLSDIRLLEEKC